MGGVEVQEGRERGGRGGCEEVVEVRGEGGGGGEWVCHC